MKIQISNRQKEQLKELESEIRELLNVFEEDVDFTEENAKKIKQILRKIDVTGSYLFKVGRIYIKIVSSDGTELTNL